ncbi:MAG TPA: chromate efflux transporter [Planctomycetota bacterium]|nr:chromate efflux transporter [Planctomycetota bacterium]
MDASERGGARPSEHPAPAHGISFRAALRVWTRVALLSFGGPAGQIAVMHRILVEEKRWIGERRFLHALNYCMLLPGPEAQQLATYVGWLLHGTRGGLAAGVLFVLPGFLAILALSIVYARFQGMAPVEAIFFGLKPAVLAIVVEALIRIGRRALRGPASLAVAVAAFVAIFFLGVPFPAIVAGAALVGLVAGLWWPRQFEPVAAPAPGEGGAELQTAISDDSVAGAAPSWGRAFRVTAVCLALWLVPLAALALVFGRESVFVQEGFFFSKTAVVTFGGAYAVLAYVAQRAVETFGWLEPGEMLDGLGMAETTPGPLIMVLQFVGFLGAYRNPGPLDPVAAGVLGSIVTTWVTFVPCFLWIFLGAPYIERLRHQRALSRALSAVTAAVVGVILNLALWFSLHVLFGELREERFGPLRALVPEWRTLDLAAALITAAAFVALLRFRLGMGATLAGSVLVGVLWYFLARG